MAKQAVNNAVCKLLQLCGKSNPASQRAVVGDSYGQNRGTEELSMAVDRLGVNEAKKATSIVELKKEGSTLGLIISGGVDKGCKPQISNLRPGSIAHRCDALAIGDCIISINGIRTDYLKHEEIINLLKNAEERVILEVEYEIPASLVESSLCVCPKVIQIKLEKENGSFGFTLRGGACSDRLKSRPLIITHVRVGGPADRDGTIKAGDRLLAVDSINVTAATLQEALGVLKQVTAEALLTIEYDVSILDAVCNASGPLLVEIDQTPGHSLGITLTRLPRLENAIVIESIKQASIAERCGALHVGDNILAVDGTNVDQMTPAEVMQLLKININDVIKLEILPVRQIGLHQVPDTNVHRGMLVPSLSSPYSISGFNTLSSLSRQSVSSYAQYQPFHSTAKWMRNIDQVQSSLPLPSSSSNASLVPSGMSGQVCHVETMQVPLTADYYGFGFSLQGPVFATELLTSPPVICNIDPGGAAEKTGMLQVGDRILAVNGKSTKGITVEEVTRLIQQSHPRVTLDIEFDVAESVVPSSGTFTIKLAKKGSGLGITIASPKNRNSGSTLIIADIRKGSVAHRTGTLQPGDKLLAIDSIRMDNCTIEDAAQILQDCDQIVKLRIQKDEAFSEDSSITGSVVYTVELTRNGGPLGITISGSEEPFEPILISGLTEDGLAERTGALHVGDRLLAINGQSLRGKPLSEAIIMLQNSGDSVTLKISKKSTSPNAVNKSKDSQCLVSTTKYITPLPSIDSAIESWDSCGHDLSVNGAQSHSKTDNELCDAAQKSSLLNNNQPVSNDKDRLQVVVTQKSNTTTDNPEENWELKTSSSHSYLSEHSAISEEDKADWTKVLEDLETCGQSQLLRQIERTIMGSTPSVLSNCCAETTTDHSTYDFPLESSTLPENMSDINRSEKWQNGVLSSNRTQCCREDGEPSSCQDRPSVPIPIEVRKVTLFKDRFYEDFGFSVSDGLYERGVYINRIRSGGPADLSGILRPLDRILQVNETKTHNYDCCLTVPLIASAGERIELLISRPAYTTIQPSDVITGHHNHPWVDDEDTEIYSCVELASGNQTLTKTL